MNDPGDLGEVRQRREALLEAVASLEAALAAPASSAHWRAGLGDAVSHLCTTLEDHVATTEAADGILAKVREDAPRLGSHVDRLVADHATLTAATHQLIDRLECVPTEPTKAELDALRDQSLELLAGVVRHRQRGSDLLYEAYNVDVGGPG
jgi:hypothetical protein